MKVESNGKVLGELNTEFNLYDNVYLCTGVNRKELIVEEGWIAGITFQDVYRHPDHVLEFEYIIQWIGGHKNSHNPQGLYHTKEECVLEETPKWAKFIYKTYYSFNFVDGSTEEIELSLAEYDEMKNEFSLFESKDAALKFAKGE